MILRNGEVGPDELEVLALIGLEEALEQGDRIGHDEVDAPGDEIGVGLVLGGVRADVDLGELAAEEVLVDGRPLHADRLARETFRRDVETRPLAATNLAGVL